jgi:hypothetical protein
VLIWDLQNGTYVGRDEYPTTMAGAYDLMIRRSGVFHGRSSGGHGRGGCFIHHIGKHVCWCKFLQPRYKWMGISLDFVKMCGIVETAPSINKLSDSFLEPPAFIVNSLPGSFFALDILLSVKSLSSSSFVFDHPKGLENI